MVQCARCGTDPPVRPVLVYRRSSGRTETVELVNLCAACRKLVGATPGGEGR